MPPVLAKRGWHLDDALAMRRQFRIKDISGFNNSIEGNNFDDWKVLDWREVK